MVTRAIGEAPPGATGRRGGDLGIVWGEQGTTAGALTPMHALDPSRGPA
jgi:hypothetical protein